MGNRLLHRLLLATGLIGALVCVVSALARLLGHYLVAGVGAQSWMLGGIALLAIAIFGRLYAPRAD